MDMTIKTKTELSGIIELVFMIGLFVLAFTGLEGYELLRMIAFITVIILVGVAVIVGMMKVATKYKKKKAEKQATLKDTKIELG